MKMALNDLGINATYDNLDLLIKRYDQNKDGKLRFSEFCHALVSNDPYYAAMVNKRSSNTVYLRYNEPRDACF